MGSPTDFGRRFTGAGSVTKAIERLAWPQSGQIKGRTASMLAIGTALEIARVRSGWSLQSGPDRTTRERPVRRVDRPGGPWIAVSPDEETILKALGRTDIRHYSKRLRAGDS